MPMAGTVVVISQPLVCARQEMAGVDAWLFTKNIDLIVARRHQQTSARPRARRTPARAPRAHRRAEQTRWWRQARWRRWRSELASWCAVACRARFGDANVLADWAHAVSLRGPSHACASGRRPSRARYGSHGRPRAAQRGGRRARGTAPLPCPHFFQVQHQWPAGRAITRLTPRSPLPRSFPLCRAGAMDPHPLLVRAPRCAALQP